ncbi:hypothetical protein RRG08_014780 [Elysia crispata]|uniref:Uncharacterized protein n=1 Tax=Elysia crispata TaxID=231223 RepID=A0AAE1E5X0_9GAST|nr:hypothetical protein RRG08_014780 [Elysia crispata]
MGRHKRITLVGDGDRFSTTRMLSIPSVGLQCEISESVELAARELLELTWVYVYGRCSAPLIHSRVDKQTLPLRIVKHSSAERRVILAVQRYQRQMSLSLVRQVVLYTLNIFPNNTQSGRGHKIAAINPKHRSTIMALTFVADDKTAVCVGPPFQTRTFRKR